MAQGPLAAVFQLHLVVARGGVLRIVRVAGAVAVVGVVGRAGIEAERPHLRLYQQVAQVSVSRAAQVCVAESDDSAVLVAIAGTVVVGAGLVASIYVVGNGVGVGTQLHDAEGGAGTGERVPHARSADERADPVGGPLPGVQAMDREGKREAERDEGEMQWFHGMGKGCGVNMVGSRCGNASAAGLSLANLGNRGERGGLCAGFFVSCRLLSLCNGPRECILRTACSA